jgi:hypothetical protein
MRARLTNGGVEGSANFTGSARASNLAEALFSAVRTLSRSWLYDCVLRKTGRSAWGWLL